jgi:ubiquinone/menaquinone biosynthesis C-methylase UbiE
MLRRPTPQRLRRYWDTHADRYDKEMSFFDRRLFADSRQWGLQPRHRPVLEVAIGTGLNLPHYPKDIQLTGLEFSPVMTDHARRRAADIGRDVEVVDGDAQTVPFDDASFDTVVCTYGQCAIPDDRQAVAEMVRVLRPATE